MHNYKELKVWQKAIELTTYIYSVSKGLPDYEKFGIRSQLTRASVSICSNIAEAFGRQYPKEIKQFLSIALGSSYEVETQLLIIERAKLLEKGTEEALKRIVEVQKMLQALIKRF